MEQSRVQDIKLIKFEDEQKEEELINVGRCALFRREKQLIINTHLTIWSELKGCVREVSAHN